MAEGIVWADSAARHGINRLDVIHAIVNHYHHAPRFDDPRVPGGIRPDLYIGPPRQLGGPLIEVMLEVRSNGPCSSSTPWKPAPRCSRCSTERGMTMTKRRNTTTADHGARTEADYAAAAEWAETNLPDLTGQTINSGDASREAARAMLDRALGAAAGHDTPEEAYARALIRRGRPSLTAPGVHSKARQVRLPDALDARLEQYAAMAHTSRSEVMRIAIEQYLER